MKKPPIPETKQMPISGIFGVLSDPARLEIIRLLLEKKEAPCGDCELPISKSTLSHHYKVLREAGIISTRSEGTRQVNCLRVEEINRRFPGLLDLIRRELGQG